MLLLLLASPALAAEHDLDLDMGASFVLRDDALLSPLPHSGVVPTVQLGWGARTEEAVQRAELGLGMGRIGSGPAWSYTADGETKVAEPDLVTLVDLRYAWGRQLVHGPVDLALGATLSNRVESLNQVYAFTGTFSYMALFEPGPWLHLAGEPSERLSWSAEAWLPLLAWQTRSPYALNDDPYIWINRDHSAPKAVVRFIADGGVAPPWKTTGLHLRGELAWALREHLGLVLHPRLDLWRVAEPLPVTEIQAGLSLGLRGSF